MADWSVEEAECIETAEITAYHMSIHGEYSCELYREYKNLPAANRKYVIDELCKRGFLVTSTEFDDTLAFNWRCDNIRKSCVAEMCHIYATESNKVSNEIETIINEIKRMAARSEVKYTAIDVSSLGTMFSVDACVLNDRYGILDYRIAELGYTTIVVRGQWYVVFKDKIERF